MFGRLRFIWKFTLLSGLIPVAVVIIVAASLMGASTLKAEYDNLYGFMLIPITNIDQASLHMKNISADLTALGSLSTAESESKSLIAHLQVEDQKMMDIITRYEEEWVTTSSPEFTAILASLGKSGLQTDEVGALEQFHTAYTSYEAQRDAILAGDEIDTSVLSSAVESMDSSMSKLVEVNLLFAELSNASAQNSIEQMRINVLGAGILISILGLGIAILMTRSVVGPLAIITKAAQNMAAGDLNQQLSEKTKQKIRGLKDEVGEVANALVQTHSYMTEMAETAHRISQGDLTVEVQPRSNQDRLGMAFAGMVVKLRGTVTQISDSAAELKSASDQLAQAANQAGEATNQVATTIQQVAKGTAAQTESVTRTSESIEQMNQAIGRVAQGAQEQSVAAEKAATLTAQIAASIQAVASSSQAGAQGSENAATIAQDGAEKVSAAVHGMEIIKQKVDLSASKVNEMGHRSNQIGVIIETIDDIAGQTNLLALNAAIEAARAGEHGKGFAVVADEVRKLAERASSATKEIAGLVRNIQATVGDAVAAMEEGAVEVEQGVVRANESGQALNSVLRAVQDVNQQVVHISKEAQQMSALANELLAASDAVSEVVQENTAVTEEMAAGSIEVASAIDSIAAVGEENSAAVEEVSASTEEMSAQVEEVSGSAQNLAVMAKVLGETVNQFILGR